MNFNARMVTSYLSALALTLVLAPAAFAYPTSRTESRVVFDASQQRVLLFGGLSGVDSANRSYSLGDTWVWTGRRWIQQFPANSPAKRYAHSMVYDSNRQQTLLFGGINDTSTFADTWIFKNNNWNELAAASAPSSRRHAALAFDPVKDKAVLFGGSSLEVANGVAKNIFKYDTWEFNGTSWTQVNADGPKLNSAALSYDEARNQIILLGSTEKGEAETHLYTGSGWKKLTPALSPKCVSASTLTYQSHNQRILFVGGGCATGGIVNETWEWDGETWTRVEVKAGPGDITGQALVYDPTERAAVLFGGFDFAVRSITYLYSDGVWKASFEQFDPGPRSQFVLQSVPGAGLFLYGGANDTTSYSDFWKLVGTRWELTGLEGDKPSDCQYPVSTYDSDRKRAVMLCESSKVFEFDGTRWFKFDGLKTEPPTRRWSRLAYDEKTRKTYMFGGFDGATYLRETWQWDGTAWTRIAKNNPPPGRSLATMFYDRKSQKTILFGGIGQPTRDDKITRYGDLWTFDGTTWVELTTATKPPARYGAQFAWDPVNERTLMFGGKSEKEQYLNDLWSWNGTAWTQINTTQAPSPRMNGSLAFDPLTNRIVLYGGYAGQYFSELWFLEGDQWKVQRDSAGRRRTKGTSATGGRQTGAQTR